MMQEALKKPREIFSKERFLAYSPAMRFKYVQKLIKEFVGLNDGVTITQIENELNLNYETIVRHLDRLEATGEFYKAIYGKTNVYFSNHKNLHPIGSHEVGLSNRKFVFSILNQKGNDVLFIQEKVVEPNGNFRVRGGVLIPMNECARFFSEVKYFLQKYKELGGEQNANNRE